MTVKTEREKNLCGCLVQVNGLGGGMAGGIGGGQLLSPSGYHLPGDELGGPYDIMADIQNQLHELSFTDTDSNQSGRYRAAKKPPSTYLCHLCFQKGHFIKDCPQVIIIIIIMVITRRQQTSARAS